MKWTSWIYGLYKETRVKRGFSRWEGCKKVIRRKPPEGKIEEVKNHFIQIGKEQ